MADRLGIAALVGCFFAMACSRSPSSNQRAATTRSASTPTELDQRVVYRKTGLAAGAHTVQIVVRNDQPPNLNYIVVDAIGSM